ncbi:MAG TPA: hypothetical protein VK747_11435 [Blastocatellia bacterium]|nr:hypothetical protein [Blastocatellia bacterium]
MVVDRNYPRIQLLIIVQAILWIGAASGQTRIDGSLVPGSQPLTRHHDYWVLPDEVTIDCQGLPNAPHLAVAPMSSRQKFQLFVQQTFDPGVALIAGGLAGLQQAANLAPNYGQGGAAYAQRLGEVSATIAADSLFTQAVMPTVFRQDPRYFRKQTGSARGRIFYAISRVAITQTDRGRSAPNVSKLAGFAASTALSNVYVPAVNRTAGQNLAAYGITLGIDGIVNILREFRSGR